MFFLTPVIFQPSGKISIQPSDCEWVASDIAVTLSLPLAVIRYIRLMAVNNNYHIR